MNTLFYMAKRIVCNVPVVLLVALRSKPRKLGAVSNGPFPVPGQRSG